jgi:hypothetical protein
MVACREGPVCPAFRDLGQPAAPAEPAGRRLAVEPSCLSCSSEAGANTVCGLEEEPTWQALSRRAATLT